MTPQDKHNLAVLTGMQLVFAHAIERCTTEIENLYYRNYITTSDYKKLCKAYGKAAADQVVNETTKRILKHKAALDFNKIVAKAKELHHIMESVTEIGCKVTKTDEVHAFNAIQQDANDICRIYLLLANCPQNAMTDAEIEAYLQRKADKTKTNNSTLIESFKLK